jgi:hypothetical protein
MKLKQHKLTKTLISIGDAAGIDGIANWEYPENWLRGTLDPIHVDSAEAGYRRYGRSVGGPRASIEGHR